MVRLPWGSRAAIRIVGIFAACLALYWAKPLFVPIFLAVIIALVLGPAVNFLSRWHIPVSLASAAMLLAFTALVVTAVGIFGSPIANLIDEAPRIGQELRWKLGELRSSIHILEQAGKEVTAITGSQTTDTVVSETTFLSQLTSSLVAMLGTVIFTLVLAFFLLTSRDLFLRKLIRISPKFSDKKRALYIAKDVERDVSIFLLSIALINVCLGISVGTVFWLLGMPSPIIWGVIAALLNFLPYIGAWIGIAGAAAVAIITFDQLSAALLFPLSYMALTMIEGQFVTPALLSRRFSLNTVVVLLSLGFWGFLWGPVGVFVALPFLIILKALTDRIEGLDALNEFLAGDNEYAKTQEFDQSA